jgi:NDP-sugar pyrophosphorylase family protein
MIKDLEPIFLILSIPRPFLDSVSTKIDALDVEINKVPLLNFLVNSISNESRKIIIAKKIDQSRIKKLDEIVLYLEHETQGALATVALAVPNLDNNTPIIIQPFDSLINIDFFEAIRYFKSNDCDVGLITVKSDSPELSYVRLNGNSVLEIVEKKVISEVALTGIFYFKSKDILMECIRWSILYRIQTNGKYYIAPSINAQIALGKKIGLFSIDKKLYYRFTNFGESQESKTRLESIIRS